jgi:hypothetical protein
VNWTILLSVVVTFSEPLPAGKAAGAWYNGINCLKDPARKEQALYYFRMAAQDYELQCRTIGETPYDLRWLGYSYDVIGDFPRAVLAYRRGLRLSPGDPKLEMALAYARSRVEYPPATASALMQPEREYWPGWLELHRLGLVAFAAYTVACLAITRWRMTRRRLSLWVAVTAAVFALVPVVGSGVEWLRRQRDEATPVVVLARSEMLRTGNGVEYPPRLDVALPRGAEVRRLFERAGWYQVQLSGGPIGWLPREAVVSPSATARSQMAVAYASGSEGG